MSESIKVPLEIALRAGDVLVAVSVDPALWNFVFGVIVNSDAPKLRDFTERLGPDGKPDGWFEFPKQPGSASA